MLDGTSVLNVHEDGVFFREAVGFTAEDDHHLQ